MGWGRERVVVVVGVVGAEYSIIMGRDYKHVSRLSTGVV